MRCAALNRSDEFESKLEMNTITRLFFVFLVNLTTAVVYAQPESESPYSSQVYDPVDQPQWYETPILWVGLVLFGVVLLYVLRKRQRA